jgi:endonuclease III
MELKRGLGAAIEALAAHYGKVERPPTSDPFGLVLWENVAYLASPAKRREAFEDLRKAAGLTPAAIAEAPDGVLEKVTARGILSKDFAEKLRACARIALEEHGGDLAKIVRGPLPAARRALRAYPGIGEPGAEKILLFAGREALLAPESNGLRVLVRLGFVREEKSYAKTYASAREIAEALDLDVRRTQQAHLVLQEHGRVLCKRSAPRCEVCPVVRRCAWARRAGTPLRRRRPEA